MGLLRASVSDLKDQQGATSLGVSRCPRKRRDSSGCWLEGSSPVSTPTFKVEMAGDASTQWETKKAFFFCYFKIIYLTTLGLSCVHDLCCVWWNLLMGGMDCLPLGKEMATHSSILAWEIPSTEEPGGLQPMGSQKSRIRLSD